jgi:GH15 family glucan-1,4-alpha-glucosidase
LAGEFPGQAPGDRWRQARDEIKAAIERDGYDDERGVFTQAFGARELDAALLRLPTIGFIDYRDERMVRTVDAIREELDWDGFVLRYPGDELKGREGAFVACMFWLAECLARQNRTREARAVSDRALEASNDLGLFAEEYDPDTREMLGNLPLGLSHARGPQQARCRWAVHGPASVLEAARGADIEVSAHAGGRYPWLDRGPHAPSAA